MTNTLNKIIHNGDEYEFPDKTYTAGDGIDIDSNNEISNSQPGAIVSASQPSSATEGDLWYDTANDVLKSYNGSAWVEVGNDSADINTKTFFINDSSEEMTKIQEAYTWVADGGEAILYYTYSTRAYYISGKIDSSGTLTFTGSLNWLKYEVNQAYSRLTYNNLIVYATDGTVTSIRFEDAAGKYIDILETSKTYPVPYIPTDPSHPATKKYVDDRDTYIGSSEPTSNKVEGRLWYDTTNDQLKVYDGSQWKVVENEYNAGPGISIGQYQDYSAIQGPCPNGFHIPSKDEWTGLGTIMDGLSLTTGTDWKINLHIPFAGGRLGSTSDVNKQGTYGDYHSISTSTAHAESTLSLRLTSTGKNTKIDFTKATAHPIRGFKNTYTSPTSSWTVIQGTLGSAGIFWNQTDGIISITSDGTTGYTIMDKNIGATTVYNDGDTLSEANCGGYFQRGNNYMFPFTGSVTTSSTQVDASNYGPGNYYSSDTFIKYSGSWDTTDNGNLRGGETGVVTIDNAITNTGVISVNGQTGDVTVNEGDVKVFEVPAVNDDISDIINGLDSGKCVILTEFSGGGHEDIYIVSGINYNQSWLFATRYIGKVGVAAGLPSASTVKKITYNNSTHVVTAINTEESTFVDESDVLTKTNTTAFTPTGDYNPATKKYVDDSVSVVSDDSGVTYHITVSNSDPTSGTASNIITLVP